MYASQRVAYKVTTERKHSGVVVANLLNQNFNPMGEIKFGRVIYLLKNRGRLGLSSYCDGPLLAQHHRLGEG